MADKKNWLQLLAYVTRFHQPRAALAERVPGGRESHSQISDQRTIAVVRWPEGDLGWDCQASRAESLTGSRLHRQTGYDPGLVSEARNSQIRRLEETRIGRPPASRYGNRRAGGETGARELWLGLRSHRRSSGQFGSRDFRPERGQYPAATWDRARPKRKQSTTWSDFIRSHLDVLAGTDFFTVEVLTWRGLATYYVLFFIHLGNRRVSIAGITDHPDAMAMEQMARNATLEELGSLHPCRYLLHDRDTKFCESFREVLKAGGVKPLRLPARSPNPNAFAKR